MEIREWTSIGYLIAAAYSFLAKKLGHPRTAPKEIN